jgi:tetrachlorobenzoquinone reductase
MAQGFAALDRPGRALGADELRLVVTAREPVAEGVLLLTLADPDGAHLPAWQPGDHLELVLPSGRIRHYSLCGRPGERDSYTVAVLRVADGRGGSVEIHAADLTGATLTVRGPRSNFALIDAPQYLLLAGGIGITPLYAMAQALAQRGASWSLVYGGRSAAAMAFRPQLAALAGPRARFVAQDVEGIPDFAAELDAAAPGTAVYCCGPEPMIRHVEDLCAQRAARLSLHVERFGGSGGIAEPEGANRPFELELAETGVTLQVPADRTALEVVHEVLPGHPYSCLGGQCGSCEVAVLSGRVDHRDEVLSDEERAADSAMMLCVSRALSQRLIIQL